MSKPSPLTASGSCRRATKSSSWAAEIQRERETEVGTAVAAIPDDVMTTERYMLALGLSYSQALKRLKDKVKTGAASVKLFKVSGVRQTITGYMLT